MVRAKLTYNRYRNVLVQNRGGSLVKLEGVILFAMGGIKGLFVVLVVVVVVVVGEPNPLVLGYREIVVGMFLCMEGGVCNPMVGGGGRLVVMVDPIVGGGRWVVAIGGGIVVMLLTAVGKTLVGGRLP